MLDVSKIRPLGKRLLVQLDSPETVTESGIILPADRKETRVRATVIALGNGSMEVNGWWLPWGFKLGDKVLLARFAGLEVGEDHLIVSNDEVIAVVA